MGRVRDAMLAEEIAKEAKMQPQNLTPLSNDVVCEGRVTKAPKQGKNEPYKAAGGNDRPS